MFMRRKKYLLFTDRNFKMEMLMSNVEVYVFDLNIVTSFWYDLAVAWTRSFNYILYIKNFN